MSYTMFNICELKAIHTRLQWPLNPGTTSRCIQHLSTYTARPSTTRYLQALLWDYFSFLTRWRTLLHISSWRDPCPVAVKSSLHNILFGEPLVCLGSAADVLLRQPGPTHQAGPDEIPLLDLFIHAGLCLVHGVFLTAPSLEMSLDCPLLHEPFQCDLLLRRMTWSLSCLSQRRSWKKSMKVEWKA